MVIRASTKPPKYHQPLTAESSDMRARLERKLDELDAEVDRLSRERKSPEDMRRMYKLKAESRRIELSLEYQGADPKKIPKDELKEIVNGHAGYDPTEEQYRERIKNRATAIRAFCVMCMSGQPGFVRTCPSVTCALWPFRMGKDPFRGFDIPKVHIEVDKEEAAEEAMFEEGDEDDEDASE